MLKIRLALAAGIACAVTLLSSGVAQAYPDCGIDLSLNSSTLVGGGTFKFTAVAGEIECDWTVTYAGKTRTGSGTSISGSFSTEEVSKKTTTKITASCEHEVADALAKTTTSAEVTPAFYSTGSGAAVQSAATQTCSVSADVTLLPKGAAPDEEDDGALPDTGGSNLWILIVGGALVVGGAAITYASRRRHTSR